MKKLFATLALAVVSCLASAATPPPGGPKYDAMFVFGGPLEDDGNYASVYGPLPAPFYQNHFTNGPDAVDYLAQSMGFTLTPSLHRVGPVQGNNFASADALCGGTNPQDLVGQIDAYFGAHNNAADPNAFYYLIIGGNDIIEATFQPDNQQALQIIKTCIDAKDKAIHRLVNAGAQTIFIDNFTNAGLIPQLSQAGLSQRGQWVSRIHNEMLQQMLNRVESELKFNLIRFDFNQFSTNDLLSSATSMQFTNTTDPCLVGTATTCDLDHYVFINNTFVTARVHQIWGGALIDRLNRAQYCFGHSQDIYCTTERVIEHTPHH